MSIELFFSNLLEPLVEKLETSIVSQHHQENDIFKAPLIIVPNNNLAKWLKLQSARKSGIFMNIDFQYLESGLWRFLELLDNGKNQALFLDLNLRQMLILHVLGNMKNKPTVFKPVIDYLHGRGNQKHPDYAKRIWQLSEKLALFFQEYEFHRSDMIHKWITGVPPENPMELCQQTLYLEEKRVRDKYFMDSHTHYLSLMEYSEKVFSGIEPKDGTSEKDGFMYLFGFSNISPFHIDLIKKLSRYYNILIFSINPCMEFWEDIHTPRENRWLNRKILKSFQVNENSTEEPAFLKGLNPLLALWGKPGREGIRMFCQLVDYDFNTLYVINEKNKSVLEKIQNQILTFQDRTDMIQELSQDSSLQIIACPSRFREVETVYNSILYNLNLDPNLKLTDIAIQVPEISIYKPFLDAVFGRHPKALSFNMVDANAEIESIFGKAIIKFLELVSGRFSRREIFELLLNPCLMQKWKFTEADIQIFAEWSHALNIFHTFDKVSKIKKGYPASDMYTWKQGLIRLRLSRIFSEPGDTIADADNEALGFSSYRHYHGKTPYFDIRTGETELIEKFCLIIETLHMHCEQFLKGPCSGKEWGKKFLDACHNLFAVPAELSAEKTVQKSLFEALAWLDLYDRITKTEENPEMDFEQFKEYIKSRLGAIWGGYGDYLTSGVTISALLPMRPIPFKIVYVLGMQEGAFPGKEETSCLDLRLYRKKSWDISYPERNRYLFLELLLSVRKKLYISYVSRDLQKDQTLQPCSLVNQLRRHIESEILLPTKPFKIVEIPLKGSNAIFFAEKGVDEFSDVLVNYSMADRIIYYREAGIWPELSKIAPEKEVQSVASFFPDFSLPGIDLHQPEVFPEKITIRQLGRFLKDPVKENIQKHMLLYEQEETIEDIAVFEDEPFYGLFPTSYHLRMEPLRLWIDHCILNRPQNFNKTGLKNIFQKIYEKYRLQNKTPEGAYGFLDLETIRQELDQWEEVLRPLLEKMLSAQHGLYHAMLIGEAADHFSNFSEKLHVLRSSELCLRVSTVDRLNHHVFRDVEIHGRLPWLWKNDKDGWHSLILTGSGKKPRKNPDHYLLEPVLTYFASRCLESGKNFLDAFPITFHVVYLTGVRSWTCHTTRDNALDYINNLVFQYLNPHMRQWLPFETVTDAAGDFDKICAPEGFESFKKGFLLKLSYALAETEDPLIHLSCPEIGPSAIEESCSRFCIFFKNLITEE